MYKNSFNASELPYAQFEALGMSKKEVLSLTPMNLHALLTGRRTTLTRLVDVQLEGFGIIPQLDVKLSLERNNDASVSLKIHPINREVQNRFNLTPEELADFTEGRKELIEKTVVKQNGEKADMIVQYDPETRELIAKSKQEIVVPLEINDIKLTEEQKSEWRNGKEIEVGSDKVRIDLDHPLGFVGNVVKVGFEGGISVVVSTLTRSVQKDNTHSQLISHTPNHRDERHRTIGR